MIFPDRWAIRWAAAARHPLNTPTRLTSRTRLKSSGDIFSRFYHYLPENSAAEALRRSQIEMAHGGTWRAAPAYWASYQLTGGSRE